MRTWVAIALGGALGSLARHGVNHVVHVRLLATDWPVATAMINVTGCFVIGLLAGLLAVQRIGLSADWRAFVFVGLLGGFTTFSTFALDTLVTARTYSPAAALVNVLTQVLGGLAVVWFGFWIGSVTR